MPWILPFVLILLASGLGFAALIWVNSIAFNGRIDRMRELLFASQEVVGPQSDMIPEIMRAYAIRAGGRTDGPALFHARQRATLVADAGKAPMTIVADQWTGTIIPGLVWRASGAMNGVPVTIIDSYVYGGGLLEVRVLSTFLASGGSGPDYDKGELMRYLSELPIYPDAILNAAGLTWRLVNERVVEVSAQSRSGSASLRFSFDPHGDIVGMHADDRPMTVGARTVPTPWIGAYSDYRQFGRYRLPAHGEVGWVMSGELHVYWKGDLVGYEQVQHDCC
jgi:hypothetical protein